LPEFLKPIGKKLIRSVSPRPVIRTKDCVGCAMCFEICPQHTIKIENKIAHIEQKNCIKCFCCHEACPQRAIDIKTNILFRVFK
ncbi:MAG: 4Fe-4S binding protein, partial [Oscillospiraceae bacterium]